ncbi:MAG: NUDIX domain-containing protein [Bacteroidetes bacterium]|nr:NUDIX domain-containing protein [Bacteroidota bacterium]
MHIKIYFNDKPLFLCDAIEAELEPYRHHDDAVYIDEFNVHTVKAMIHEMQKAKVHAGVFLHPNLEELKKAFWKKFTVIQAGGGLVLNPDKKILMIHRRGKWDLPKGKLDPGEAIEECALREVREETGLSDVHLDSHLLNTYHTYHESGKFILKESHWYRMHSKSGKLKPQAEEDITEAIWAGQEQVNEGLRNSVPSIVDVVTTYRRLGV